MTKTISNGVVVIMAGGAGTRFWPVSTEARPKQFLHLFGDRSLFQQSVDRALSLVPAERILVLTNERFLPQVFEQVPQIPGSNVIGEPMRRDTAAAIALASLLCEKRWPGSVMAVLTADHVVEPADAFHACLSSAAEAAEGTDALYTFGIRPDHPSTGYGYLELGKPVHREGEIVHYELSTFKEKPDLQTAMDYLESERFVWNSGMFVWRTAAILAELERQIPDHVHHLGRAVQADETARWREALRVAFEPLPRLSIDYAVMEKARDVRAVTATFEWKDLGGWLSVEGYLDQDEHQNAHRGCIAAMDAQANLVFCEDPEELVALIGLEQMVVVRAGKRTLVVPKGRTEEIKGLVHDLL